MSRVVLNPISVRRVAQHAGRQAVAGVVNQALPGSKRMAPRSPAHLSGSRRPKSGPRLADSISQSKMVTTATEVYQDIVSPNSYTETIHNTSKAHRIRPRRKKALKFFWRRSVPIKGGRRRVRPSTPVYFDHVWHPGNRRAIKFLTVPLQVAAKANGFKYRSNRA